ncbi:hypothetical protein F5Y14DRAFT_402789 [Nemania sp. NC0429]|nr:hypothetical protein F5Y14DRAFT_402789 [Nemania sp. NC0429]
MPTPRACDRCIRRKIKCGLQQPDCARCSEAGLPCTYSTERKKPGPRQGSRRRKLVAASASSASIEAQSTPGDQDDALLPLQQDPLAHYQEIVSPDMVDGFNLLQEGVYDFGNFNLQDTACSLATAAVPSNTENMYPGYSIGHQQERELLVHFFNEVHPAIPLFRTGHFLKTYDDGLAERNLLVTIVTLAAKVLGPSFWKSEEVELCMKYLLKTMSAETTSPDIHNGLNLLRLECLLAYYEFHQFPGSSSWMRISSLARRAYTVGIYQIDNPRQFSACDRVTATGEDIEDWRYLFWCIYCLDSYSNISVGTPFVVELECINTALPRISHDQADSSSISASKLFLPDDIGDLWKTAKGVVSAGIMINYNIHLITTTALRHAGYIMRVGRMGKRLHTKITALKVALVALRLSLPSGYLNPARNALAGESCIDHHMRLANILHIHMASLIVSIPHGDDANETEFAQGWLDSLGLCQMIVSVVKQWDNQHSPRIDPAICFIIFSAICLLELHRRSTADPTDPLISSLDQGQHLLLLFLEQFSNIWALPGFLIQQFRRMQDRYGDTRLTYAEVNRLLSRFKAPLHPETLERVSRSSTAVSDMNLAADTILPLDDLWSFGLYDPGL